MPQVGRSALGPSRWRGGRGAAIGAFFWSARGVAPAVSEPALVRLTSNPADMSVTSAHISPDGRHLAFADATGLQVRIIDNDKTHRLAETKGMNVYGWTPDSTGVLASHCDELRCSGWVISLVGQERHRTGAEWSRDDDAMIASVRVSPDGLRLLRLVISMTPRTLLVDPMNGAPAQRLATGDIIAANWSPDGKRVLFVRRRIPAIESGPSEGGTAVEVFRVPKDQVIVDAIELPDRSILFTMMPPGSAPGTTTEIERGKLKQTRPEGFANLRVASHRVRRVHHT